VSRPASRACLRDGAGRNRPAAPSDDLAAMPVCVIFNPTARGDKARRFRRHLDALAHQVVLKPTTAPGAACALAEAAVAEGFDTLVAAGGDGTVNEVLNGLARAPEGLERARLAVLPLGTVNVFAKEHGLPLDLKAAWKLIQAGTEKRIDLPQVEVIIDGESRQLFFAQMAGAGLDSRAIECVDWTWKKRVGPLAYVLAGLKAMRGRQPRVIVEADGRSAAGELVLIGNGRFYGGRFPVFPRADPRDGWLEVRAFPRANWAALLRFGWECLTGRSCLQPGEQWFQARTIRLSSEAAVPLELDGDLAGQLPVVMSVRPLALRMVAP